MPRLVSTMVLLLAATNAHGDSGLDATKESRSPSDSWSEVFTQRYISTHLFSMPTASVVGAYKGSFRTDGSLLSRPSALSLFGVVAVGVGEIAQVEYRKTEGVVSGQQTSVDLPSAGLQLRLPYRHRYVPDTALAIRVGIPIEISSTQKTRSIDLYFVASQAVGPFRLHGGLKTSFAAIETGTKTTKETLLLPTAGIEWDSSSQATLVAEIGAIPKFFPQSDTLEARIDKAMLLRAGARWRIADWLSIDGSFGYHVQEGDSRQSSPSKLTDWDIRMGAELHVPWGGVMCKTFHLFCNQ